MPTWKEKHKGKVSTPQAAVKKIRSGQRVFIGSGVAEPQLLVQALANRGPGLADTQITHILTLGIAPYADPRLKDGFRHNALFIGPNVREAIAEGRADYTPIFLSEIPRLFRHGKLPIDVALIQVSPPDEHGYCSYGVSVDVTKAAAESARHVVAEINPNMPRALGDSFIHINRINSLVPSDEPLLEAPLGQIDDIAMRIGQHIADLIEDGSTLQLGIGTIPDAVLSCLGEKNDLGIHSEMFSDGVIELVERGVINGSRKTLHPEKIVASFVMGSRRLYDFIDNNPMCEFHPTEYTNDPFLISQHERMVAINSALQVDLTGQVCADSLGAYFYSGIGGQVDFIRGASRSSEGKPIIALPSTAESGNLSRIVSTLTPGAGVVTSRGDVHYVATEFGVAELHGKTMRERAMSLIHIAHPKFREKLMEEACNRSLVYHDEVAVSGAGSLELRSFETDFTTDDGQTIRFRPIHPADEDMMRELFYTFSPETVYHRFFSRLKSMPHTKLREFVNIDYVNDMALVGVVREDMHEMIVAVGRYALDNSTNAAEVAFVVKDNWQHHGLGISMFEQLLEIARKRGIVKFTADVLADNSTMLHIFHNCAPTPIKTTFEYGIYHLSFSIAPRAENRAP
ncbi:MAG: GNAT family N-acetyltransferase [Gammaproteobacteria bacterium]|nr:GNAT family N-acetyltransferase [Gammaproteobacteria bacterium]